MIDQAVHSADTPGTVARLRRDLARGDAAVAAALPVLRYLVAAEENALLGEEIVTRVRAMLSDLAAQLLDALIGEADRRAHAPDEIAVLTRAFLDDPLLLGHVHALAIEWQLTERLQERLALDPVASPLVLARIAAGDASARGFLAAQARWSQAQRRMALPIAELPAEVLEAVLAILRTLAGAEPALADRVNAVEAAARSLHGETENRLALAKALVREAGDRSPIVAEDGAALFLTRLAMASGQTRETATLATQPGQQARLVLGLQAAGASAGVVEEQILALHPGAAAPQGLAGGDAVQAAAILSGEGLAG